ncbi:MAG: hypothetical protein WC753_03435 [Candidatus Gracilibacteria bacterium]
MSYILPLIFGLLACVAIGFAMYFKGQNRSSGGTGDIERYIQENAQMKAQLEEKTRELGKMNQQLNEEKTAKDELAGKGKAMFAQLTDLQARHEALGREKEKIEKELTQFQAQEIQKEKAFTEKVERLDRANESLENEKKRIRKEDEEEAAQEKANRDRMWAEHEEKVKSHLGELCKLPQYNFQSYDNKHLPEGFGGKFKPDFMIEFLGQYVIFDAKVSKSENLQTYVSTNVKSTADKINNDAKIYPMVFFVVPTDAIAMLSKTHFQEQGYEFFIISPEAIPVLLAAFKRISAYELAEQMDPRDRENIVTLIAEFDHHINMRNALDIIASQTGISVLSKVHNLKKDLKEEIRMKKGKMRIQPPSPTEMKTLMLDTDTQQDEINAITSPQAAIPEKFLDSAGGVIGER